ncbi:ATP-binding protein [Amycolatopsis sp. FBCC-B4732]|uniref:ATP-binding protein n=1 Tax=Amycolatopsis sp. FBCC-B4732 TaxID=3079339 RepID=UPI001FF42A13|nr:ATP-binding protein [Amycolatopsis sp. FBCC-B4732]UOX89243.1 ATP-binding protein [Amycolatopsis sp. FBCC-B4732]
MTSLGRTVRELQRRAFTGRDEEVALFRDALGAPGVLFVHGVGGVGKSALLDVFADVAAEKGFEPVRVDARHLALGRAALPAPAGDVLLIDTYELLEPVDDWVREQYLPSLPASCLVVIAGRRSPGPRWRADPAWRTLTRVVALGNLSAEEGSAYLTTQDVPGETHDRLLKISRGHPLTLSLMVDAVRRGAAPRTLSDLPDVVGPLLAQMLDEVPSARHRTALEVCALLLVTTEDLLRSMVGGDAGELFAWLRTQAFVDESPYGLYPHDVVRDAITADLRWRDPSRYADLYRRKLAVFHDQVRATADERERLDLVVLTVVLNGARSPFAALASLPPTMGAHADGLRDGDRSPIVAMTAEWQGSAQAELVAHWLRRRPGDFRVFRTETGEPRGYGACLDLTEADLGVDPGTDAMWGYAAKFGPPRAGERVRAWRFFLDRDHGQRPSPSLTLFVAWQMLDILLVGAGTAWSFVGAFGDGELWAPAMESLDFWAATEAGYEVGGARFPVFAHDWRRTGITTYTDLLHTRRLGAPARPAGQDLDEPVLSEPEFTDAVRSALRTLHTPELLRSNPLLRSRLVRQHERAGRTPAEILRDVLDETAATLKPDLGVLIERTFLRPIGVQERVANSLHLSFNTYRRHRDKAVAQLTELLWARETG